MQRDAMETIIRVGLNWASWKTRVFPVFTRAVSHVSRVLTDNENEVFAFTFRSKQSAVNRSLARSVALRKCFV